MPSERNEPPFNAQDVTVFMCEHGVPDGELGSCHECDRWSTAVGLEWDREDAECCEDCTDGYHAPMCVRWEP